MKTFDLGAVTAYALAVKNGFEGTVEEWLDSLVPKISVGTVETGEPDSDVVVTMDGNAKTPVLNFRIPRGKPGAVTTVNGVSPDENGNVQVETSSQSDWNAAEGEPGHVLNRTHCTTKEAKEISFIPSIAENDGYEMLVDAYDRPVFKISDYAMTEEDCSKCTVKFENDERDYSFSDVFTKQDVGISAEYGAVYSDIYNRWYLTCVYTPGNYLGTEFASAGTYFITTEAVELRFIFEVESVVKLDEKYLPNIQIKKAVFTDRPSLWEFLQENVEKVQTFILSANGAKGFYQIQPFVNDDGVLSKVSLTAIYCFKNDMTDETHHYMNIQTIMIDSSETWMNTGTMYFVETLERSTIGQWQTMPDAAWGLVGAEVTIYYYSE